MKTVYEEGEAKRKRMESLISRMVCKTEKDEMLREVAQMVWWLLDRWCREHDNGKKKILPRKSSEELDMPVL